MKTAKATSKPRGNAPPTGNDIVEFNITLPQAKTVAIAGTFNGWSPERTPLRNEGGGLWRLFLPLKPGRYEYRYVVDGLWQEDPFAKESAPNPFGGRNSVLVVAGAPQRGSPTAIAA